MTDHRTDRNPAAPDSGGARELAEAIRAAVIDWNTLGTGKVGADVSMYLAGALLASPQFARLIAEAKAEALREAADKWQWGEWTALTPKVKPGGPAAVIGAAQVVTDWLRDRAALTTEAAQ